jgi:hypothetical protein
MSIPSREDDMQSPSSGWSAARDTRLLAMLLVCLFPLAAFGEPSDDAYLAGYIAAVLERQLNVSPRSLKVKDGVVNHRRGRPAPRRSTQD